MRFVLLAAVAGYGAATLWVPTVACAAPEEDGCASVTSTTFYVLMVGTPLVLVLLAILALVGLVRGSHQRADRQHTD